MLDPYRKLKPGQLAGHHCNKIPFTRRLNMTQKNEDQRRELGLLAHKIFVKHGALCYGALLNG